MKIVIEINGAHPQAILEAGTEWMHSGGFTQFQAVSPYPLEPFISFPRDEEIVVIIEEENPLDKTS